MLERVLATFAPHHAELRRRLIRAFASIVLFTLLSYVFSRQIAEIFVKPLFDASPEVHQLVYTYLPEAFLSYLKLAFLIGLLLSFPVILFESWSFISPGLKKNEKRIAVTVVFWGTFLFTLGGLFAYFGVLPRLLGYFMSYAHASLEPLPKFGKYLTFVARMIIAFGLAFQIPFLMIMAGKAGLFNHHQFKKKRLYSYSAIVIFAFMISAGDLMATALLFIPLFLLYETGILLCRMFVREEIDNTED